MCDGRPFASPLFRRLPGRGASFCGFPFHWVLHFATSFTRCLTVYDAASRSMEDFLYECVRSCDTMSCLFFTALWLQRSQSILVQETPSAKDIDLTCYKMFPIKATTCLQVGPMYLDWPVGPFARFDHSRPSPSPEVPIVEQRRDALPASTRSRWRQDALQPPRVLQDIAGLDACGHFPDGGLRCITCNTRGLVGSGFSKQTNREFKLKNLKKLSDNNDNILCLCMEETSISRLFMSWPNDLVFLCTFIPGNESAGGSAMCIHTDILPEDVIVTHLVTCQGRDNIVNTQSGRHSLVIVSVHFELELTLRRLRERFRLITPHWPSCPNAVGIIFGAFNICELEEGRFNVWNQKPSLTVTRERPPCCNPFFRMSSRFLNLISLGGTLQPMGSHAGLIGFFFLKEIYLWLRRETFSLRVPCL